MTLYTIYNADLPDIPGNEGKESSLGYVNDIVLVVVKEDFHKTTQTLKQMMIVACSRARNIIPNLRSASQGTSCYTKNPTRPRR